MNSSLVTPIIIVLFSLFLNHSSVKPFEYNLQGLVTSKKTGKPLADIYLYTVKGEEEAITNQKGEFRFVTWKNLPVTIHIHYKETTEVRVVVSNPSERIIIML